MIQLQNLTKYYPTKQGAYTALDHINLTIPEGQIFGIIGKSGAGKSTLIRCLNRLEIPSEGRVLINDQDISQKQGAELRAIRHRIGMIFQHFNLLSSANIFENVALPLTLHRKSKHQIKQKVNELLDLVGLSEKATAYPNDLSGGQKQRVAIARALACDPVALLSDEATSALDPETTNQILDLLKRLQRQLGLTVIMITHEMEVVRKVCDQVAILDQGKLCETGPVTELFLHPASQQGKRLIRESLHLDLPEEIKNQLVPETYTDATPVVQLTFVNQAATTPFTSALSKRFDVDCNILQAHIERVQTQSVGVTICHMTGEKQACHNALEYLKSQNIQTEVIGYAPTDRF